MFRFGQTSDKQIIGRVLGGDRAAFRLLVERYQGTIHGVAYAHLGNHAEAEDVVQEAFLRAFERLDALRADPGIGGWLVAVARNYSRDVLRRRKRESALPEQAHANDAVRPMPERDERRRLVREHLDALDDESREILVLHYFFGRSAREIAVSLEIGYEAARKRIQRARELLGRRLVDSLGPDLALDEKPAPRTDRIMGCIVAAAAPWKTSGPGAAVAVGALGASYTAKLVGLGALAAVALIGIASYQLRPAPLAASTEIPATPSPHNAEAATFTQAALAPAPTPPKQAPANSASLPATTVSEVGVITNPSLLCSVSGNVWDFDGRPLAGVEVMATAIGFDETAKDCRDHNAYRRMQFTGEHIFKAVTDGRGAFKVSGIRYQGCAYVLAQKEGLATGLAYGRDSDAPNFVHKNAARMILKPGDNVRNVNIYMRPGRVIKGRVVDGAGRPVADAVVGLISAGWADNVQQVEGIAHTGSNGQFVLGVFEQAEWCSLHVNAHAAGMTTFPHVVLDDQDLVLRLQAPATLSGTISAPRETKTQGLQVLLEGLVWNRQEIPKFGEFAWQYQVDVAADGSYSFPAVDPGPEYTVRLETASGNVVSDRQKLPIFDQGSHRTWNWTLYPPCVIRGHVSAKTSGRRLPQVRMIYEWIDNPMLSDPNHTGETETDANGAYTLRVLSAPRKILLYPNFRGLATQDSAWKEHYGKTLSLKGGEELDIEIQVPDPCTLTVRVVDNTGNPVSHAQVRGHMADEGGPAVAGETDNSGRFSYSGFAPDVDAWLECLKDGYIPAETPHHLGAPGTTHPEDLVELWPAASIRAVICDEAGAPIPNTEVSIAARYGKDRVLKRQQETTEQGILALNNGVPADCSGLTITVKSGQGTTLSWSRGPIAFIPDSETDLGTVTLAKSP